MSKRIVEQGQDDFFGIESARTYAEHAKAPMMRRGYNVFVDRIAELGLGGRFLEIGAGPAVLTTTIAEAMPEVRITAIELSPDMITVAREHVENEGLGDRIDLIEGDATDAQTISQLGQFDLVFSSYSLHHWDDPKVVIPNALSAVVPGGVLLIHDLRRVWWLYWIPSQDGFIASIRAAYTPAEIGDLLAKVGIEQYEIKNGSFYLSVVVRR